MDELQRKHSGEASHCTNRRSKRRRCQPFPRPEIHGLSSLFPVLAVKCGTESMGFFFSVAFRGVQKLMPRACGRLSPRGLSVEGPAQSTTAGNSGVAQIWMRCSAARRDHRLVGGLHSDDHRLADDAHSIVEALTKIKPTDRTGSPPSLAVHKDREPMYSGLSQVRQTCL